MKIISKPKTNNFTEDNAMNECKEYRFNDVIEFSDLDEETFVRMIPDLMAWHKMSRKIKSLNLPCSVSKFIWCDDGKAGELLSIEFSFGVKNEP